MYDYDSSGDKVPGYMKYKDKIGYICVRGTVRYIGSNAFFGMPQVESIELQSDLPVTIGKRAFMNCRSIKNFDMYNDHKIEEIGPEAFRGCTSLWDVDLSGTQAKRIGDYAFYGCKNLRYVDLESCWDTIGKYAFASCPKLDRVKLSRYIVEIGTGAFEKSNGRPLIIYDGLRSEWTSIFHGKMRDFPDEYKAGFYKGADGLKHYSDEYGKDVTGTARINGKIYVFDKKGAAVCDKWVTVSGRKYRTSSTGAALTGFRTIGGKRYYFMDKASGSYNKEKEGMMMTGWQYVEKNGTGKTYMDFEDNNGHYRCGCRYYLGTDGVVRTGWQTISGKKYYLSSTGAMYSSFVKISGAVYYFDYENGMVTGWKTLNRRKYYFGTDGAARTGWQTISNKRYHFDSTESWGIMDTGWKTIDGKKYHFASSGAMDTGFKTIAGKKYYFMDSRCAGYKKENLGVMATGTKKIDGKTYKFSASGVMQ